MALSTYSELVESVTAWLAETSPEVDLASRVPDFIALVESDLNNDRDFRILDMQKVQTITPGEDEYRVSLPDDYLEMDYLDVVSDTEYPALTYVAPTRLRSNNTSPGRIVEYSIINGELWIYEAAGANDVLEMGFYVKVTPLTDANPTNWLLSKAPDIYLYGSLSKAVKYLEADNIPVTAAGWKADYEEARTGLISANKPAITTGGTKVVSMPVPYVV